MCWRPPIYYGTYAQRDTLNQQDETEPFLVRYRWEDWFILLLLSSVIAVVMYAFRHSIQVNIGEHLAPFGQAVVIGLLAALAAVVAWLILASLGVNYAAAFRLRQWKTNPPVWPIGIVAFLICCAFWELASAPDGKDATALLREAGSAVVLFFAGSIVASFMLWVWHQHCPATAREKCSGTTDADIHRLASDTTRLIEWVEREEPICSPEEDCFSMAIYARRIVRILRDRRFKTIGLIGPYGCGKSSILGMVQHYLKADPINSGDCSSAIDESLYPVCDMISCSISGWGFHEGTVTQHILDMAIGQVSQKLDCLELASLPASYRRLLTGSGGVMGTLCSFLGSPARCMDVLRAFDSVMMRARKRLVIFLEDVDRNIRDDTFLQEVAVLLEGLKGMNNISFVLAIGQDYMDKGILVKLCEHVEVIPQLAREPLLEMVRSFKTHCLAAYPQDIHPSSPPDGPDDIPCGVILSTHHTGDADDVFGLIGSLVQLVTTPRVLKACLRRTWLAWQALHGEIDFDDLFICGVLHTSVLDVFAFLNENVKVLRSLLFTSMRDENREEVRKKTSDLRQQLDELSKGQVWSEAAVSDLIRFLFPGYRPERAQAGSDWLSRHAAMLTDHLFGRAASIRPQGVQVEEPTDYWNRLNMGEVRRGEIRDQEVMCAIRAWATDKAAIVFRNYTMVDALLKVKGFADKVEQFGVLLNGEDVRRLASDLFRKIRSDSRIAEPTEYPGYLQLWRLSLTKEWSGHKQWIAGEISVAVPRSLHFANRLYAFWRYASEHASAQNAPTPELRTHLIDTARNVYGENPSAFIEALDREHPHDTHELVVVLGSLEEGGPGIENEDWGWLGSVLLAAASQEPELVIPQIALLLTDGKREPGRRGGTVYTSFFNDVILAKVFGNDRTTDLMRFLGSMKQVYGNDTETKTHVACCQGRAREWLKVNTQGEREHAA